MEKFMEKYQHLAIQLEEIKSATNNFDENRVIGKGGFGKVYIGEIAHSKGRSIGAFKCLDRKHGQGRSHFWMEIVTLSRFKHENLISLLGFCYKKDDDVNILVYEYASNRSLDRHLKASSLTWTQRIHICIDAARGLSHLHNPNGGQERIIHRDIKSSNILLDENWNAKLSDMGLSIIAPANQEHEVVVTSAVGTTGYIDPRYLETGILTKESDVYSFGVLLLEVLCGRVCIEGINRKIVSLVPKWRSCYEQNKLDEIILQDLIMQQMDSNSLEIFLGVAFQCLNETSEDRPMMADVVEKLEIALRFQMIHALNPPKEYAEILSVS